MANLSALAPFTTAAQALSNLVLVTPQSTVGYAPQLPTKEDGTPSTAKPPAAILFHYEGQQKVTLQSDITDHFIEDNTAVQDHIALKPERVSVKGYIGELNNVPPPALTLLKTAADRLTVINAYAPQVSLTAALVYQQAFFLYQTADNVKNSAVAAWNSLGGALSGAGEQSVVSATGLVKGSTQNRQQVAFAQFYGYWRQRTLFTVQTPWAVFQNMAIEQIVATQDEETRVISDFEVQFKMIRVATTIKIGAGTLINALGGRASAQGSGLVDLGTSSPVSSIGVGEGIASMGVA